MQRHLPVPSRRALVLVAAAIACSSDDTTAPRQSIEIAVSSPSITVERGATISLTASLVRGGGFAGPVTLAVSGLPNGVAVTLTPDELIGGITMSTINMVVSSEATPGTYTVTITASATISDVETTYLLRITDPADFHLSAVADLTVAQGHAVTTTIQITRIGDFNDIVFLTVADPLPVGIQGVLQPAFTAGVTSTLTLTVASSVAPGTYLIPVFGTSASMATREVNIRLTVTTGQAPDFELVVEPSTLTVKAGESVIGTVILIPLGGYDKYADLSLVSPPAGVTAMFEWFWGWEAAMIISVAPTVAPGSYEMTLRGTAPVGTHDVGFRLTVTDAENFTLTMNPSAVSVEAGSSGHVNVDITRVAGYNGVISLSLVNPPNGIAGTFSPVAVSANAAVLSLTVQASVPLNTYTLTVRGTGAGIGSRDATLTLTVLGAPASFSISAPSTLSVVRGTATSIPVQITRHEGFSGAVSLTIAGLPAGIDGAFEPAITSGNSSTLVLTVAASAGLGRFPISINATSGTLVRFAAIELTVTTSESPDFELVVQPSTLTVKAGASVMGEVILTPLGGYDKFADLSLVAPPAGITAGFEWFMDFTATMIISVAPSVLPGTYEMTLRGTAPVGTHDVGFRLTVTAVESAMTIVRPVLSAGIGFM